MLYVLYLSIRKITEKNFPFPFDMDKFTKLTPEDIAQVDFLKLLPNQTVKADFSKPSMYGCESIRNYYRNIFIGEHPNYRTKGMAIGDIYLRIFYKTTDNFSNPEADIFYDYYVWASGKKGYDLVASAKNIGANHKAVINTCILT